ncbi:MAG: hypothetical protein ABW048_12465 [Sphingobium sp.]
MAENPSSSPTSPRPNLLGLIIRHGRLISGWRQAWRLWSVRIAALGAALMSAWPALPPHLLTALPYADRIAALLFVAVAFARVVAQGANHPPHDGQADSTGRAA